MDVTEQTIRLGGNKEETLNFGFAAGDKIILSFEVLEQKDIREIEVLEYPNTSKFSDYKTKKVEKTIIVNSQNAYVFRIKNSGLGKRVCKIKIQRIPASEATKHFNTTVRWETKQETTYKTYTKDVIVSYDTTYIPRTKRVLVKTELSEDMIINKTERVHSKGNLDNRSYKYLQVTLPQNEITTYKTKEIKSWAYWIGVGKEAQEAWKQNVNTFTNIAQGAATILGGGPLTGLAIGTISNLAIPTKGEDVAYCFIPDYNNAQLFMSRQRFMQFDHGKGVAAYGKNNNLLYGTFFVGLENDNQLLGIDVNVKISILWETKKYKDESYTETKIHPRYEKQTFKAPVITTEKVPITG